MRYQTAEVHSRGSPVAPDILNSLPGFEENERHDLFTAEARGTSQL